MIKTLIEMPNWLSKKLICIPVLPVLALLSFASESKIIAQEALVTFYTHGTSLSGMPGTKHGVFFGGIYDGDQAIVYFHEGFVVKNDRFVTFHLPAGDHDFSASYSKRPAKEHHIRVALEPGHHYFFRASSESSGVIVVESEKGRLDQVSCQTAQDEAHSLKPLNPKHQTPILLSSRSRQADFPKCN